MENDKPEKKDNLKLRVMRLKKEDVEQIKDVGERCLEILEELPAPEMIAYTLYKLGESFEEMYGFNVTPYNEVYKDKKDGD